MTKLITTSEFADLAEEARNKGEILEQWERSISKSVLPQQVGRGGIQRFQLRHDCHITVLDGNLRQPLCMDSYLPESQSISLGFYTCGSSRMINPGLKAEADRVEGWGETCLSFLREIQHIEYFSAEQPTQCISISIDLNVLRSFSAGWNTLPMPLQQLIEGKEVENFHRSLGTISPEMRRTLREILECSYEGTIRQIYLESRMLDLLALQLIRWTECEQPTVSFPKLRRSDIERLHLAREIMGQSLEHPPSLLELSQKVGINDHKLKWGFRHLFGMTVFEYVHQCQMRQAQRLLTTTQLSITEISYTVGYASLPSFSAAFRKRFGMSPREYRDRHG